MRARIYEILEAAAKRPEGSAAKRPEGSAGEDDKASRRFDIFILSLIALNVIAFILETVPSLYKTGAFYFDLFDKISLSIFATEYIFRIWSVVENPKYKHPITGRFQFALTPMALIDFIVLLPLIMPFLGGDLRIMRTLRLFRVFRILKLFRYSSALGSLGRILASKKEALITSFLCVFALVLMTASLMYFAENEAQPNNFSSIPQAMWWAVVTLSTVGYGDVYPVTMAKC